MYQPMVVTYIPMVVTYIPMVVTYIHQWLSHIYQWLSHIYLFFHFKEYFIKKKVHTYCTGVGVYFLYKLMLSPLNYTREPFLRHFPFSLLPPRSTNDYNNVHPVRRIAVQFQEDPCQYLRSITTVDRPAWHLALLKVNNTGFHLRLFDNGV